MRSAHVMLATLLTSAALPALLADFVPGRLYIADAASENCWGPYPDDRDLIWEVDPATGASRIFAAVIHPACGVMSGLAFTPDGSRLRASNFLPSQILQFDGTGAYSVALGPQDGIGGPFGSNNLAYDPQGNFFVVNSTPNIMRFPAGGEPGQVFAGPAQGITETSAIATGLSGEVYYIHNSSGHGRIVRFSPLGEPYSFPEISSSIGSLSVDDRGDLYAWASNGIYRYAGGRPEDLQFVSPSPELFSTHVSMTFSALDGQFYLANGGRVYSLNRDTDAVELVTTVLLPGRHSGPGTGIAVFVPEPGCGLSGALALLLLWRRRDLRE